MTEEGVLQDAARIWNFLDQLAESDPSGYRKFIEEQIASCKKQQQPPVSKFVIRAKMKDTRKFLYVHFCSWNLVPESKSQNSAVIVKCGEVFEVADGQAIALGFNPKIFTQHKFNDDDQPWVPSSGQNGTDFERDQDKQYQLVWLGLHYLGQEKQLVTEESHSVVCSALPLRPKFLKPEPCHGSSEQIYKSIGFLRCLLKENQCTKVDQPIRLGTTADNEVSLATEFHLRKSYSEASDDIDDETRTTPITLPSDGSKSRTSSKPLIEEVPDLGKVNRIPWTAEVVTQPKVSTDSLENGKCLPNQLKLVFDLPGIESGNQCDLEIAMNKLALNVQDPVKKFELLQLELPCPIDVKSTVAKFHAKKGKLVVIGPIASYPNK